MKKCTIYYATVVVAGGHWTSVGSISLEPVRVEEREPLGKEPEFCCDEFAEALNKHMLLFSVKEPKVELTRNSGGWISGSDNTQGIHFCPFCGAKIVCVSHLKLREISEPITRHVYHLEIV